MSMPGDKTTVLEKALPNDVLDHVKNYLAVDLSYDLAICLPYKAGLALMAALESAERITMDRYGSKPITFEDAAKRIEVRSVIVSQKEYREQKMKALLGANDE